MGRSLLMAALLLAPGGGQVDRGADAQAAAREIEAHVREHYAAYLRDYVHVFIGYQACSYDFVDEDVLNALADDALRDMTTRAATIIRSHTPAGRLPDEGAAYAARLAVLTAVGLWATELTAEITPDYEAVTCATSSAENRTRYEALERFPTPQ